MNIIHIVIIVIVHNVEAERDNHVVIYTPVQTGSDWFRLVQTGSDRFRLRPDQTGSDRIRLVQTGSDWIRPVQTG